MKALMFAAAGILSLTSAASAAILDGTTVSVSVVEDNFGPVQLLDNSFNPVSSIVIGSSNINTFRDFGLEFTDTTISAIDTLQFPEDGFAVTISGLPTDLDITAAAGNPLSSTFSAGVFEFVEPFGTISPVTWDVSLAVAPVPEPATFALFGIGLVGIGTSRKIMRRKPSSHCL